VTGTNWTFCAACGTRLTSAPLPLKPVCPACGWFRPTYALPVVLVLASSPDGRIVYTRRNEWPPGAWALVAGFIEVGETAELAAVRELVEETGLVGRKPQVRRTLVRDDLLLVCVEVAIDGTPEAGSDVDDVLLAPANPNLIPPEWQAREFVEEYARSRE
jgi:8-oxo-dGTP pyrophosphatase MutT (NUDIX family)